jgi:hypothetical protein
MAGDTGERFWRALVLPDSGRGDADMVQDGIRSMVENWDIFSVIKELVIRCVHTCHLDLSPLELTRYSGLPHSTSGVVANAQQISRTLIFKSALDCASNGTLLCSRQKDANYLVISTVSEREMNLAAVREEFAAQGVYIGNGLLVGVKL